MQNDAPVCFVFVALLLGLAVQRGGLGHVLLGLQAGLRGAQLRHLLLDEKVVGCRLTLLLLRLVAVLSGDLLGLPLALGSVRVLGCLRLCRRHAVGRLVLVPRHRGLGHVLLGWKTRLRDAQLASLAPDEQVKGSRRALDLARRLPQSLPHGSRHCWLVVWLKVVEGR